jgi:subtilisin family serine protease
MPLDGNYNFNRTGAGVHAYILDSGIRLSHSDFEGRVVAGFDAFNDGQNSVDCYGHGTHVAGTVGGKIFGVAKRVTLHSVRVLDCRANGTTSTLIAGIDWVTNNHQKPAVANISIISGFSAALDAAIVNSIASGVTYIVAAGNNGTDACTFSPAHVSSAITVGAADWLDNKPAWSNFGFCVDVFAPGVQIESTSFAGDDEVALMSGTSMAAPHVAGAAALYLEENPAASPAVVAAVITGSATQEKLLNAGSGSPDRLLFASPPPPTAATVCLSGEVSTGSKLAFERRRFSVTITSSETQTTFTDERGFYEFCDLPVGETYVIAVRGKGYEFSLQVLTLTEDGNLNFYAAVKQKK